MAYLVALLDLALIVVADACDLLGLNLAFTAIFIIVAAIASADSLRAGPYKGVSFLKMYVYYPGIKRLPRFVPLIIVAAWLIFAVCLVSSNYYFAVKGTIHGGRLFYAPGKTRPATPYEQHLEDLWILLGSSGFVTPLLIYPALMFFYHSRIPETQLAGEVVD